MNQCLLVLRKEWLNFVCSDRSVFFIYLFLVAGWGMLLATMDHGGSIGSPLWLVFFSVIIAANFSTTVFVSERMSGSLEILLTSGLSRSFSAGPSSTICPVSSTYARSATPRAW